MTPPMRVKPFSPREMFVVLRDLTDKNCLSAELYRRFAYGIEALEERATPPSPETASGGGDVERLSEIAHDAYEREAVRSGWGTNPASSKPWSQVPEENRTCTRAAVRAMLAALAASVPASEPGQDRDALIQAIGDANAKYWEAEGRTGVEATTEVEEAIADALLAAGYRRRSGSGGAPSREQSTDE